MPITATVSRSYSIRMIALAILCLVFGVWGMYDYYVGIPARQSAADRFSMLDLVRTTLSMPTTDPNYDATLESAKQAVQGQVDRLVEETLPDVSPDDLTQDDVQQFVQAINEDQRSRETIKALAILQSALRDPRNSAGTLSQVQTTAYQIADKAVGAMDPITAPSGFDRAFQWVYILCLPFAPYFLWKWWSKKSRHYRLDDDGALHLPDGSTWSAADIADIDMNRWMEKSQAYVVHTDGSKAELDDYFYHDMHLIVGHFAHQFHPDQWHEDARQKREEDETSEAGTEEHPTDGDDDAETTEPISNS